MNVVVGAGAAIRDAFCAHPVLRVISFARSTAPAPRFSRAIWYGMVGVLCMAFVPTMIFSFAERIGADRGFSPDPVRRALTLSGFVSATPAAMAGLASWPFALPPWPPGGSAGRGCPTWHSRFRPEPAPDLHHRARFSSPGGKQEKHLRGSSGGRAKGLAEPQPAAGAGALNLRTGEEKRAFLTKARFLLCCPWFGCRRGVFRRRS